MGKLPHPYMPNSVESLKEEMLEEIGVEHIDELYRDIPENYMLNKPLDIPEGRPEQEVKEEIERILAKNKSTDEFLTFLGAGCWPHYIPAAVLDLVRRTEFLTSYTPYQPEISQGMLQALFEYQSLICELTGMDVANSSMYDWSTAAGEAVLMAVRHTRRRSVLVPETVGPERLATIKTYAEPSSIQVEKVKYVKDTGQLDLEDLKRKLDEEIAAVYIENPTYLGFLEAQVEEISEEAHRKGALFIVGVDPTSLGVVKPPGEYGADIVVGEGQPLGIPMSYGGPLLGIFACRDDRRLLRQMPGRIIGMTTTISGEERGFCMALQTREQHIRREMATSNICTNEALCAVTAAIYLALIGPQGLRELGETVMERVHYAITLLSEIEGLKTPLFDAPHFKEFTVNVDEANVRISDLHDKLFEEGIQGGKILCKDFPELGETALYCVTELHSREDIDRLASTLERLLK